MDVQNFCTAGKRTMKFAAKSIQYYPCHLGHVATLPYYNQGEVDSVVWVL